MFITFNAVRNVSAAAWVLGDASPGAAFVAVKLWDYDPIAVRKDGPDRAFRCSVPQRGGVLRLD